MSNVIQLLEKIGQDSALRSAATDVLNSETALADVRPEIADALKFGDQEKLVAILGARTNIVCAVFPAKQDEDEKEDEREDDKDEDERDSPDEKSLKNIRQGTVRVAIAS